MFTACALTSPLIDVKILVMRHYTKMMTQRVNYLCAIHVAIYYVENTKCVNDVISGGVMKCYIWLTWRLPSSQMGKPIYVSLLVVVPDLR